MHQSCTGKLARSSCPTLSEFFTIPSYQIGSGTRQRASTSINRGLRHNLQHQQPFGIRRCGGSSKQSTRRAQPLQAMPAVASAARAAKTVLVPIGNGSEEIEAVNSCSSCFQHAAGCDQRHLINIFAGTLRSSHTAKLTASSPRVGLDSDANSEIRW